MTALRLERLFLRAAGLLGLAAFAFFFAITWSTPLWVEEFASGYLKGRVAERVEQSLDVVPETAQGVLSRVAAELRARNEERVAALRARAQQLLDQAIAQVRNPECACRLRMAAESTWIEAALLSASTERLTRFIQGTYMNVVADLKHEIRIFTGVNAACFLLLLVVSFAKPGAARHLFFPGVLLLCSTLFCAWLYVFSQNWLLTIVEGSYVGFAYAAYLGIAFLFVCDIAFNRGRATTRIVNAGLESIGSVASLVPC